jgi:hypothetical protein
MLVEFLVRNLKQVKETVSKYKVQYDRIMTTSMVASRASTLLVGVTSAMGEVAKFVVDGWRSVCIIAAGFGFVATISSGISQQRNLKEKLSEGKEYLFRLKYLNTVMVTGIKDWVELSQEYEGLAIKFPDLIG